MAKVVVRHTEVPLDGLPRVTDGLRIVHLSDLHLRKWGRVEREVQRLLTVIEHDLLFITGDFCDRPRKHIGASELTAKLLEPVQPRYGTFAVLGNHDLPCFTAHETPIRFLRNENIQIKLKDGTTICIAGVEQNHHRRGDARTALNGAPPRVPRIVLTHYPSTAFELPSASGILMLAGHTHGGQIRLPGLGCVFNNDRIPVSMSRGLHLVNGNWLHVSAGVGASGPIRTRLFCPPEIGLITLRTRVSNSRPSVATRSKEFMPISV